MNSPLSYGQVDLARELPFRLGGLEIFPASREVVCQGQREMIEPRVMQVLVVLVRGQGAVVSRDELINSCWGGRVVGEDAITRSISRLRRLSETSGAFRLETIPRVGYRLTPADFVPVRDPPESRGLLPPWRTLRWRLWAAAAGAFLLLLAGLVWWLLLPAEKGIAVAQPAKFSIAVLPFTPPSGDREAEQLGDAVAAGIADALVHEGLEVVSPAKARLFRGASKAEAAQALHADFVIDGEIRREGGTIKVPIRTIEAASGKTLVADTVEAPAAEAASLPDFAAASALSNGWGWILSLNPSARWDLRVIAGSLKVVHHLTTPSEDIYAYDLARQLAASAPGDAFAQYLHAKTAALFMPQRSAVDQRLLLILETRTAVDKTLQLDPEFGEAYGALARVTPLFDWGRRAAYLRKGLRLRATSPLVYMDLLALQYNAGYLRSGARMAENAYSNHPRFDNTMFEAIKARLWLGDAVAARSLITRAMKSYPAGAMFPAKMFEATAFTGALDEASSLLKAPGAAPLLQSPDEARTYVIMVAALRYHRLADVKSVVDNCLKAAGRSPEFQHLCFVALVKMRRLDDAFRLADLLYPDQRATSQAEIERRWLAQMPSDTAALVIPSTAPLRADPRFRDVVDRIGLLKFWRDNHQAPDFCASENAPVCGELKS